MSITKVGVLGAGAMGREIAQIISQADLPVVLKDIDQDMLDRGLYKIKRIYQRQVDKGKLSTEAMQQKLTLITPTLEYADLNDVDLVIEAAPEEIELKKKIFQQIDQVCPPQTILASNTSALSISELAAATGRPGQVIGLHFFNPAHVMKLVEVIPGLDTGQETVNEVVTFVELLNKLPVVVQECPGFLVSRLLLPYLKEAAISLEEGVASARGIDAAMVDWGWPMGPFRLIDMLGVDIIAHIQEFLGSEYGSRMKGALLFDRLVGLGRLGEKSGAGFYSYEEKSEEPVQRLIVEIKQEKSVQQPGQSEFSPERLVYPLINEAILCFQENIASAEDIDTAMITGTGMTYRGEPLGPLGVADRIGLDTLLTGLESFEAKYGPRFHPAWLLKLKVRAGHLGQKAKRGFYKYA